MKGKNFKSLVEWKTDLMIVDRRWLRENVSIKLWSSEREIERERKNVLLCNKPHNKLHWGVSYKEWVFHPNPKWKLDQVIVPEMEMGSLLDVLFHVLISLERQFAIIEWRRGANIEGGKGGRKQRVVGEGKEEGDERQRRERRSALLYRVNRSDQVSVNLMVRELVSNKISGKTVKCHSFGKPIISRSTLVEFFCFEPRSLVWNLFRQETLSSTSKSEIQV